MKKIGYSILLLISAKYASAQKVISGNVKSDQGAALRYVYVHDQKSPVAAYTDSLGNYTITAPDGGIIQFDADGYASQAIALAQLSTNTQTVLKVSAGANSSGNVANQPSISTKPINRTYLANEDISSAGTGGGTISGLAHQKGNVRGNRYLFDNFVHGFVITPQNQLISTPGYMFDYDKIGGNLMLSINNGNVTQVNDEQIKSFTLIGIGDKPITFAKVSALDKDHYTQVLASGPKYSIYKTIKTNFIKSDFVNNGVTSHGNDYDEYTDKYAYFVAEGEGQPQEISLKKKAVKNAFSKEGGKLDKFMSDHSSDEINDNYLSNLGAFLNQ